MDYVLLILLIAPLSLRVPGVPSGGESVPLERHDADPPPECRSRSSLPVPFTKLAHVVLFFFDRISAVHWQLKPGAGDKIAEALFGEEVKI